MELTPSILESTHSLAIRVHTGLASLIMLGMLNRYPSVTNGQYRFVEDSILAKIRMKIPGPK